MKKIHLPALAALLLCLAGFTAHATEVGQPAPGFSLSTLRGDKTVNLQDYQGKVVYLDFWASWCAPCRTSFPLLNELYKKYKDKGFVVVAVNLDEDKAKADKFLQDIPVDFTVLHDASGGLADQYVVESMPTSFIVDQKGVVQHVHHGFVSDDIKAIEQKVTGLLSAK